MSEQKIRNLTPHTVIVDGVRFEPEGVIPRLTQINTQTGYFAGVPVMRAVFGDVVDLPKEQEDTLLIVSAMIRQALPWRKDLASPGDLVRDENGVVIGCKNLIIN